MKIKDNDIIIGFILYVMLLVFWLIATPIVIKYFNRPSYQPYIFEKIFELYIVYPILVIPPLVFLYFLYWLPILGDYIYEDRLEWVELYGIYNVVYFKDIIRIKEIKIRDYYRYIFDDGRKDNKYDGVYTKSGKHKYHTALYRGPFKYNYQPFKKYELTELIENKLKLPIEKIDHDGTVIDDWSQMKL